MRSRTLAFLFTMVLAGLSSVAGAETILFNSTECPSCVNTQNVVGNEWSAFGLTVNNAYWYTDVRDTFDGQGLSIEKTGGPLGLASIDITGGSNGVTFDYWVIQGHAAIYTAFNGLIPVGVLAVSALFTPDKLGTYSFDGNITSLVWADGDGFAQVSSLTITPVPEPEIYAMLAAGLGLMGFVARRRKQQLAAV